MPAADIGSATLYYDRRGSGEPLLLIQGMAGHRKIWGEPFLSELADTFDVVAFDNRGVGDSTDVPGSFSIADLAGDAIALMDALGWPSAHVMGISLGGMVAQELVLGHPERVRTLVLGCTYAGGDGSTIAAPGPLEMFQAAQTGDVDRIIRASFAANLSPAFIAVEANYAPFKQAALAVAIPTPLIMRQAQAAMGHNAGARLAAVTAPTLVLHGTADRMVVYSNGVHIAGLIPGARLHTFDGVGHLFWWERPAESAKLVREHRTSAPAA